MKSKVLKIGTVLLTCVCLISFLVLPVSALSSNEGFMISSTKIAYSSSLVASPSTYSNVDVTESDTKATFIGFSGNNSAVNYYRPLVVQGVSGTTASSYTVNVKYYGVYFNSSNGFSSYSGSVGAYVNGVKPTDFKSYKGTFYDNVAYGGEFTFQVNSDTDFKLVLYCGYNSTVATQHYFYCDITAYKNDGTQDIIDNQNSNAQEIIDAQQQATQEQTDAIMNDWDGGVDVDDGTKDEFANAEDAALGGKSDAEIQDEVDNALNFDISVFDSTKIGKIHSLFDNVLDALGSSWQSLFILSLTLGLGAFLIGRRYG